MPTLWLTYAWKDNESEDVDHVIATLQREGLDVHYDRAQLLAGRRLWDQIDAGIRSPDVDGWAIYLTENSLRSEPCQEELAYALDRTLRTRGSDFPLIGLFPEPIENQIIPSAIATRLFVTLRDSDWARRVNDALIGKNSAPHATPLPFKHEVHQMPDGAELEVWPRTGAWPGFRVAVPLAEKEKIRIVAAWPRGLRGGAVFGCGEGPSDDWYVTTVSGPVDTVTTGRVIFNELPSCVLFGPVGGDLYSLQFS